MPMNQRVALGPYFRSDANVLVVPIDEAQPGMTLAAAVTNPENPGQDLLKAGYTLEASVLRRMKSLGIDQLLVQYPGLEDLDRHLAPSLSPARQMIYTQIRNTMISSQQRTHASVSYCDYYSSSRDLITTLLSQGQHPVYLEHMNRMGNDAVAHATSVAHLSLLLGLRLENYLISERKRLTAAQARDVVNLGVGAMLHDVGKTRLPEQLQSYHNCNLPPKPVTRDWQEHPRLGYDMVRQGLQSTAAAAILHHHQRFDGSGFPNLLTRDKHRLSLDAHRIHIFSRIIAVCDLYDRLCCVGKTGEKRTNLEILAIMRAHYLKWLDPVLVTALQQICPPFPPGSHVQLSDGANAIVVDVNPADLARPIIRRILPTGEVAADRIDLTLTDLKITKLGHREIAAIIQSAASRKPLTQIQKTSAEDQETHEPAEIPAELSEVDTAA